MAKQIKAKCDFGINTIVDPIMMPDGFTRVCDGLEIRSGSARTWNLPSLFKNLANTSSRRIWEYRGKWYESTLYRSYHGEYINAQEAIYFTEEGPGHSSPQKIINGAQVRLGTRRPLAEPQIDSSSYRYPSSATATVSGAGGIPIGYASYRIAGISSGQILVPCGAVKVQTTVASSVTLQWSSVLGVDGYAIFGRTDGAEKLIKKLGKTATLWLDDGTTSTGSNLASSYDVKQGYQYVYTYYRKVGLFEDESGPSPISNVSDSGKIPIISRSPSIDGSFLDDTLTFTASSVSTSTSGILTATTTPGSVSVLTGSLPRVDGSLTTFTTSLAHGMVNGAAGWLGGSLTPISSLSGELKIVVPFQLGEPSASLSTMLSGGSVPAGPRTYRVVGVRGNVATTYGNPAQTLGVTFSLTVVSGTQKVVIAINSAPQGTDYVIIYRDGTCIGYSPLNVATWTDDGTGSYGATLPAVNETASRCFFINNVSVVQAGAASFSKSSTDIVFTGVTTFLTNAASKSGTVLAPGDAIYLSGMTSLRCLNGMAQVIGYPSLFAITASCAVNVLTVSASSGTIAVGSPVILGGAYIGTVASLRTGTGGNGDYNLDRSPGTVASVVGYIGNKYGATISKYLSATSPTTDTGGGTLLWRPLNGYYRGWRVYRVGDTAEFLRCADLDMYTTVFTDTVSVGSLGIAIPTAYTKNGLEVVYDRAPDQLKRMVEHLGMRFGIVDNLVRWTPTLVPDAWPDVYYAAFPSRPVALVPFRGHLCVLCEDGLYGLIGNTPSTLSPAGPFSNLGCIAPFSAQASNRGLVWLSKSGLAHTLDGVSASLLGADRAPGRYYYAPSTPGKALDGSLIGYGWFIPPTQTTQFAESMRQEDIDLSMYPVEQVDYDIPVDSEMTDIKSFYYDDRYFLYFSGQTMHARSACITVDMSIRHMPVTTLPVKPVDVHVSLGGTCYALLEPYPITTVIITSPTMNYLETSLW